MVVVVEEDEEKLESSIDLMTLLLFSCTPGLHILFESKEILK